LTATGKYANQQPPCAPPILRTGGVVRIGEFLAPASPGQSFAASRDAAKPAYEAPFCRFVARSGAQGPGETTLGGDAFPTSIRPRGEVRPRDLTALHADQAGSAAPQGHKSPLNRRTTSERIRRTLSPFDAIPGSRRDPTCSSRRNLHPLLVPSPWFWATAPSHFALAGLVKRSPEGGREWPYPGASPRQHQGRRFSAGEKPILGASLEKGQDCRISRAPPSRPLSRGRHYRWRRNVRKGEAPIDG
jgi:hypothetical protein